MYAVPLCPLPERLVLAVGGADAREFLQGLVSNDMNRASPAQAIYAALLTPQGKYLFDFFVVQKDEEFLLDCEAARGAELAKRLNFYKLRSKVVIRDASVEYAVAAAPGRDALAALGLPEQPGATSAIEGGIAFTDPRMAAAGARLLLAPGALAKAQQAPHEAYHGLRVALGLPEGSPDIAVEKYFLLEANFEELNGVDFKKGCYVGQELVSRMKHRAALRKRILPVRIEGPQPQPGTPVLAGGKEVGMVHSVQGKNALAYLRLAALAHGAPALQAGDAILAAVQPEWLMQPLTENADDED